MLVRAVCASSAVAVCKQISSYQLFVSKMIIKLDLVTKQVENGVQVFRYLQEVLGNFRLETCEPGCRVPICSGL